MTDDFKLEATPDVEKMIAFVHETGRQLQENIMEREERLVLTVISNEGLERLIALCQKELRRRPQIPLGSEGKKDG